MLGTGTWKGMRHIARSLHVMFTTPLDSTLECTNDPRKSPAIVTTAYDGGFYAGKMVQPSPPLKGNTALLISGG